MPAAHRHTDVCTGHGCWPPRPNIEGSPNVFVNNLGSHRETDQWSSHCYCIPPFPCHGGNLASGSPNVYVNGLQKGRIGDPVNCGSKCATGSPNVFVND
ncbi:MAG: PAAR domain-containing protein [Methylococcales bacterium]|jgi:uncharacterized Zn-binding protein involved in type VI secretion|nr:PAAR domain-containing protein [Methylococcales bacterium]